jgi:PadR family transcriptional regulator, regulatory protein PadR
MQHSENMDHGFFDNWTTQARKGILELCILTAIREQRLYGYDIAKLLRGIDGLVASEGTIYPILSRFKREGLVKTSLVESNGGPARKYYELTPYGEQQLARMLGYWQTIKIGIQTLIQETHP